MNGILQLAIWLGAGISLVILLARQRKRRTLQ